MSENFDLIKDMKCVTGMEEGDLNVFKNIFEKFFDDVVVSPEVKTIDFTPHDFTHLFDLYKIISDIFVFPVEKEDEILSSKELLFLNLAVFFHDIGMHGKVLNENERNIHAQRAYEEAKNKLSGINNPNIKNALLGDDGIDCIARICGAHSNSNAGNASIVIGNLNLITQPSEMHREYIRERMLAAILRLADELDICKNRVNNSLHREVTDEMPLDVRESDLHWKLCRMFNYPVFENGEIKLVFNTEYCGKPTKFEYFQESKISLITHHISKVEKSLNDYFLGIMISEENICDVKGELKFYYYKDGKNDKILKTIPEYYCNLKINISDDSQGEAVFWYKNSIELASFAQKTKSIISSAKKGHIIDHKNLKYLSNEKLCIYDYINMHNIIEPGHKQKEFDELLMETAGNLIDKIMERDKLQNEDILIVGIDSIGSILATSVGMRKCIPIFSYASKSKKNIYPNIERHEIIRNETEEVVKSKKHIFLISDMIYTFSSMTDCIKELKIPEDKITVFCLFDRKPFEPYREEEIRKVYYNNLCKNFCIYTIIDDMKSNFVKTEKCVCCMLKEDI